MSIPPIHTLRLAAGLVLWFVATSWWLGGAVIDGDFQRRHEVVDLSALVRSADQSQTAPDVSPSQLGILLWHTREPLELRLGHIQKGDQLRFRLRAGCHSTTIAVQTAAAVAELEVADRFKTYSVEATESADNLVLRRVGESACDVHVSRASVTNVRGFSRGLVEYYRYPDLLVHEIPLAGRAAGWTLLLVPMLLLVGRIGSPRIGSGRTASASPRTPAVVALSGLVVLILFQIVTVAQGLILAMPAFSFWLLLLAIPMVVCAARWLVPRVVTSFLAVRRGDREAHDVFSRVLRWQQRPRNQMISLLAVCSLFWMVHLQGIAETRWQGDLRGFPLFQEGYEGQSELRAMMPTSESGYDGQFYALLAADPLLLNDSTESNIDSPSFRARRIFVPAMAWLISGGSESRAVLAYVLLTWLGTFVALWMAGLLLIRSGGSPLWLVALCIQAGTYVSTTRALLDTSVTALTLLTLLLWQQRARGASMLSATAAALTKETAIFVAPAMALDAWREGQWRDGFLALCVPIAFLAAWLGYLRMTVQRWTTVADSNLDWPFVWVGAKLASERPNDVLLKAEIATSLSILLAFPLAVLLGIEFFRTRRLSAPEWNFLAITALAAVSGSKIFGSVYDYSRVFLLIPFLAIVLAAERRRRDLQILAAVIVLLGAYAGYNLVVIENWHR
jgi:hypothetical protein